MSSASEAKTTDLVRAAASTRRASPGEDAFVGGWAEYRLLGPDGEVKLYGVVANLITDVGDEYGAKRVAGASIPVITGMRLGTGTTAPAKNGAGAAIVTYVSGSNKALESGYPTTANKGAGAGYRATYRCFWAAGVATANGISECVVTNEAGPSNVAGTAGNTIARFLLSPTVNKGSLDTLEIDWHYDVNGS